MAFFGSLDLRFSEPQAMLRALDLLIADQWHLGASANVLPLGETDYEWVSVDLAWPAVRELLEQKRHAGEVGGVCFFHGPGDEVGVQILLLEPATLSFSPSIGRRSLATNTRVADWSWYLDAILSCLGADPDGLEQIAIEQAI